MEVLIVEDEMLLAMDIEAMIEDSGHHVLAEAASVEEVEALPDEIVPQLAFVDLHLAHGADGFDVTRIIQRRWPDALIVFVTANVARIPPDFAGADGVIAKPFSARRSGQRDQISGGWHVRSAADNAAPGQLHPVTAPATPLGELIRSVDGGHDAASRGATDRY